MPSQGKASPPRPNSEKALFIARNRWSDPPRIVYSGGQARLSPALRIRIGGLGILQVRKRAARMGRNPATGEQIQIKASKKVAFRASKELKEAI